MVMKKTCHILALFIIIRIIGSGSAEGNSPEYVTAILGQSAVLSCSIEFPDGLPVPYIVQWNKQGDKVPIYIWYAGYPPHKGEGYKERISLVNQASINISDIQELDQGWYNCNILFLNRVPDTTKNGTWVHLDVHAPPHFTVTPQDVYYVKVGDSLILSCEADGTPKPTIVWLKDEKHLEPSGNVQLFNNGHEVRVTSLRQADIGNYICEARNGEGHITHTTKIIIAGGAVITTPPHNITKLESEKAEFVCDAKALPGNITYKWYRNDIDINELSWLVTRASKRNDGILGISPLSADDTGKYTCEVSNGIGTPQSASAYLDVEFSARVTYTPSLQYLPLGLSGVIRCHFEANPPFQFVTWTKDKRVFKPSVSEGINSLNNGSLFIRKVSQAHQGLYTCTPFNFHGTENPSGIMEVLVREPPKFTLKPKDSYQITANGEVKMPCEAQGNPKPQILWRRADGTRLPKERTQIRNGNITLKFLRKSDHGYYECVVQNEVATLVTSTLLIVEMSSVPSGEGTTPHAPTNLSVNTSASTATVSWLPAYDGGYTQTYTVWYRESNRGDASWRMIKVAPDEATSFTVYNLTPETSYDFKVLSRNIVGESQMSPPVKATTRTAGGADPVSNSYPTDSTGSTLGPTIIRPAGGTPKPGATSAPVSSVTVAVVGAGLKVTWLPPIKTAVDATHYAVEYRSTGDDGQWKPVSALIRPPTMSYVFPNPQPGKTYHFRVIASTNTASSAPSDAVQITVPGPKPSPPRNVTVVEVDDNIKISWSAPTDSVVPPTHYVVEHQVDDSRWSQLGSPIKSTSYLLKSPIGGKTYYFRIYSRTQSASSIPTEVVKFNVPARFKDKAITAGVVGGILFFIVAIILSICAVKICNKRKRRRHERAYSMVACRVTDARNGGHGPAGSPVPLRKFTESRVSGVNLSALRRKVTRFTRQALGLPGSTWWSMDESRHSSSWGWDSRLNSPPPPPPPPAPAAAAAAATLSQPLPDAPMEHDRGRRFPKSVRYQVKMEYSQPAGYISRMADGRFRLYEDAATEKDGFVSHGKPIPSRQAGFPSSQQHQYGASSPSWMDGGFHFDAAGHLVGDSNTSYGRNASWDRMPAIHTIYSPRDPRFRTSSPGPIAHLRSFPAPEDLSSVLQPSSAERSFPSTVSSRFTHSGVFSPSYELPSLRVLHENLPHVHEEYNTSGESPFLARQYDVQAQVHEGYYDYPHRIPIPVQWHQHQINERPTYLHPHQLPSAATTADTTYETPRKPPRTLPQQMLPRNAPSPTMIPPQVPDIEWLEMSPRQVDAYKRIQAQDGQRPLATSSPPHLDRRVARVPPSPVTQGATASNQPTVEDGNRDDHSDDQPVSYTRDRLQEVIGQVRSGGFRVDRPFRDDVPVRGSLSAGPVQTRSTRGGSGDAMEGDSTITSDEAFQNLGVAVAGANSRVSVTSAGTGSSGRGSKAASISHSRGDSLQEELEYSPASRSSSSGFASRNTSQSQPSPHQVLTGGLMPPPLPRNPPPLLPARRFMVMQLTGDAIKPPLPPLNISTDENYEFDSASPRSQHLHHPLNYLEQSRDTSHDIVGDSLRVPESGGAETEVLGSATDSELLSSFYPSHVPSKKVMGKYDNVEIERRIPALKEEFRRRQQERHRSEEMESEC